MIGAMIGTIKTIIKIALQKIREVLKMGSIARCVAGRGTTLLTIAASRIAAGTFRIIVTTIMVFELFWFRSTIKYGTMQVFVLPESEGENVNPFEREVRI